MLDYVGKKFRGFVNFILCVVIILFAIYGAIIGYMGGRIFGFAVQGDGEVGLATFLGLVIGIIIGLFVDILFGGFIANFLIMVDNIEKISNTQQKILTKLSSIQKEKTAKKKENEMKGNNTDILI